MAKGFNGGFGGMNMNNLMKQAQKMQKQMEEAQKELETKEYEVTSGGGAVKIKMSGKKEITAVEIKPEVVDPDDIEMEFPDVMDNLLQLDMKLRKDNYKNSLNKAEKDIGAEYEKPGKVKEYRETHYHLEQYKSSKINKKIFYQNIFCIIKILKLMKYYIFYH